MEGGARRMMAAAMKERSVEVNVGNALQVYGQPERFMLQAVAVQTQYSQRHVKPP
jgi:hypothetical protein